MKQFLLSLTLIMSTTAFASDPMNSIELAGTYQLKKTIKNHCSEKIRVSITESGVYVDDIREEGNEYRIASFHPEENDSACRKTEGDIGPVSVTCTQFNKRTVSSSSTEPITIVGYIREIEKLNLSRSGTKLNLTKKNIQVPFGILGIWDNHEYKCVYNRI